MSNPNDLQLLNTSKVSVDQEIPITTSKQLAEYLSSGKSIKSEISAISTTQADMRSYLSLYARSQLKRIEKLTEYLNNMEDQMMNDISLYEPDQFMQAMRLLQESLSQSLDLLKMVSTDDKYLNILYQETNNFISQGSQQVNVNLPRESRDKLRDLLGTVLNS